MRQDVCIEAEEEEEERRGKGRAVEGEGYRSGKLMETCGDRGWGY